MITLKQPSLALHAHDVPSYRYRMWTSWVMPKSATAMDIVYYTLYARDQTPEQWLRNLVINCHGLDGQLFAGGAKSPSIRAGDLDVFTYLNAKDIGTIWLVACKVASTSKGKWFCQRLAQIAGCSVVAADASQYGVIWCPKNCVDNYEGHTFEWDAAGYRRLISGNGAGIPGVDD